MNHSMTSDHTVMGSWHSIRFLCQNLSSSSADQKFRESIPHFKVKMAAFTNVGELVLCLRIDCIQIALI